MSCMRHLSFNTILVALLLSVQTLSDERKASSETSRVDTRADSVLWRDPGLVARLDLAAGPGGKTNAPRGPYTFIKEIESGKKPKLKVRDARGSMWSVKWGDEVKAEIFASRLAWAAGYFTLPTYFVESGRIERVTNPGRAGDQLASDGSFTTARFQAWEPNLLKGRNWAWNYNPFLGSKPLQGLKIIVMVTSNWDSKDARDVDMGTNTAIIDYRGAGWKGAPLPRSRLGRVHGPLGFAWIRPE